MELEDHINIAITRMVDIILEHKFLPPYVVRDLVSSEKYRVVDEWKHTFTKQETERLLERIHHYNIIPLITETIYSNKNIEWNVLRQDQ